MNDQGRGPRSKRIGRISSASELERRSVKIRRSVSSVALLYDRLIVRQIPALIAPAWFSKIAIAVVIRAKPNWR